MQPSAFCSNLRLLSRLLNEGLAAGPGAMDAWLGGLRGDARALAAPLRDMLGRHWADADTGWIDALPALVEGRQPAPAQAGDAVGPWRLLRPLGRGGTASVWLAERTDADAGAGARAALKLPHAVHGTNLTHGIHGIHGTRGTAHMQEEIAISTLMHHPNVGRVVDAGRDAAQRPYLALAHIDGPSLADWCRLHRPDLQQRLRLFLQIARAVGYIHGRGVVHRDLKPGNVLVCSRGQAHVIDFGIAVRVDAMPADAVPARQDGGAAPRRPRSLTPGYASPEQARGGETGFASDVYSLGVLLLELMTGRRAAMAPPAGDVHAAAAHGSWRRTAVADAGLPGACAGVLTRALAWQPEHRHASASRFADALQDALPLAARLQRVDAG